MSRILICGILQVVAFAQPMGTCEDRIPAIESRFASDFNSYVKKYHQLTLSAFPGSAQLENRERIFKEFMALHQCPCW